MRFLSQSKLIVYIQPFSIGQKIFEIARCPLLRSVMFTKIPASINKSSLIIYFIIN